MVLVVRWQNLYFDQYTHQFRADKLLQILVILQVTSLVDFLLRQKVKFFMKYEASDK